jgi:hypothetical protein
MGVFTSRTNVAWRRWMTAAAAAGQCLWAGADVFLKCDLLRQGGMDIDSTWEASGGLLFQKGVQ